MAFIAIAALRGHHDLLDGYSRPSRFLGFCNPLSLVKPPRKACVSLLFSFCCLFDVRNSRSSCLNRTASCVATSLPFLWDFQAYALQQLKIKTDSEYLESAFSTDLTDEY